MIQVLGSIRYRLPAVLLMLAIILAAVSSGCAPSPATIPPPVSTNAVTMENFALSPPAITVTAGTTVTWTNKDITAHTVTSDTGIFDSGNLASNAPFQYTFTDTGTFTYHCALHPYIKGTVIVR